MAETTPNTLKRPRLAMVRAGAETSAVEASTAPDLIGYFSQRGGKLQAVEKENCELTDRNAQLRSQLDSLSAEFQAYKVAPVSDKAQKKV